MHNFKVEKDLHKVLQKFFKKDKRRYEIIWKKIKQIISDSNIEHYKNLKAPLNNFKRIHLDMSFVLIFKYNKTEDKIYFYDLDHHDNIYKKKFE
jgi:YafQ family addiction module toxin component